MPPHGKRLKGMTVRQPLIHLPFRFGFSNGTLGQGGSIGSGRHRPEIPFWDGGSTFVRRNKQVI